MASWTRSTPGRAARASTRGGVGGAAEHHAHARPLLLSGLQLGWRAVGDDAPLVHDDHARAGRHDLGQVVGRQDDRALAPELAHEVANLHDLVRVEAAGGLVEDEDVRLVDQRLGEADALLEALGQRPDGLAGAVGDAAEAGGATDAAWTSPREMPRIVAT
jgi:hypothetical protein